MLPGARNDGHGITPRLQRGARARDLIYAKGRTADHAIILCQGTALRFNRLSDGRRKIHSVLLSGDPISPSMFFERSLPFSVEALTDCRFSVFDHAELRPVLESSPDLVLSLLQAFRDEENDAREHALDLALRTAQERVSHIMLGLMERVKLRHVIRDGRYPFPLRQQDIADFAGLSVAHVNRVIADLRKAKIVEISQGVLTVFNPESLRAIGEIQ
jgi:CRP-like cAMP-binding protein